MADPDPSRLEGPSFAPVLRFETAEERRRLFPAVFTFSLFTCCCSSDAEQIKGLFGCFGAFEVGTLATGDVAQVCPPKEETSSCTEATELGEFCGIYFSLNVNYGKRFDPFSSKA